MIQILEILIRLFFIYLLIGLSIHIVLFLIAKIKNLDEEDLKGDGWYVILNSLKGVISFLLIGSFKWLPVTVPFYLKRKHKTILRADHPVFFIIQFIKNPNEYRKESFIRKYQ